MSSNPTKSQAINAETTKNPKEGSDWLGGPQNGSETPGESYFIPKHRNEIPDEASKQAPDRSGSQALVDDFDGTSSNDASWTGRGKA
jgi:hypothetical protein